MYGAVTAVTVVNRSFVVMLQRTLRASSVASFSGRAPRHPRPALAFRRESQNTEVTTWTSHYITQSCSALLVIGSRDAPHDGERAARTNTARARRARAPRGRVSGSGAWISTSHTCARASPLHGRGHARSRAGIALRVSGEGWRQSRGPSAASLCRGTPARGALGRLWSPFAGGSCCGPAPPVCCCTALRACVITSKRTHT